MNEIKLYIYSEREFNREQFEHLLRNSLEVESEIRWLGLRGEVSLFGSYESIAPLYTLMDVVNSDLQVTLSVVFTPRFDDFFSHIVMHHFTPGVSDMTKRILQLWSEGRIQPTMIPRYFKDVNKEQIDTIEAFIQSGMNASAASRILYIHRNTFNYRMAKFIEKTGFDVRYFYVATLVQLLLSL